MQSYRKSFGRCAPKTDPQTGTTAVVCSQTALQQGLVSLTLLFIALGGAISGIVGNYLGRRGTIQVGAAFAAIGAGGMLGTSGNFTAYLVCKCVGGVGLGHIIAAAPVYGAECVVASKRGMLLALYNIGLGTGNAVAAAVCLGSSSYTSNLAWQIPIICQIPLSFILGFGVLLFPESPRWLLTKGRDDAAKRSFAWYYAKTPEHPDVLLQVQDVQRHIEMEKLNNANSRWTEIYQGGNFRRTIISGLIMVGLAITGSKFVGPYGAIFLAKVGIKNPFLNNFILASCTMAGSLPGPFVIEYGGRRFSMLWGYSCMTVCMLIIAIVGSVLGQNSSTAKVVLLVFLFLWAYLFGMFIGTSVWISAPEQHSLRLRTYGQASTTLVYQIFGFAGSFYGPYMLSVDYGNMGLSVGYFYSGMSSSSSVHSMLTSFRCDFCNASVDLLLRA
jgi:SP family sugar:H+ symporter-like MFS transporter